MAETTLIRQAEIYGTGEVADLRLRAGQIELIAKHLPALANETIVEAGGAALLPGLHDHHIHLVSLAAALQSLQCGPPAIHNEQHLITALEVANASNRDWLRGIGYHPSVAGDIDRHWLDQHIPNRPCRIQHRGGRLWVLNSKALETLSVLSGKGPAGLEYHRGTPTGRLYEEDVWLRQQLGSAIPALGKASQLLASYGITGITDTTPHNGQSEWRYFAECQQRDELLQRVRMMGSPSISGLVESPLLQPGELKIHLLESQLPDFDHMCERIASAHLQERAVAVHCVTLTELVFTLSAFEHAGTLPGDRIEHASVTPDEQLATIHNLGLRVITQPHFISERGDQYLRDVEAADRPWLYRCRAFLTAGVPLAAGSDASFGSADPWASMRAAIKRRTPKGILMGSEERLTAEQALDLFLSAPDAPGLGFRKIETGAAADLCLLNKPWAEARDQLTADLVSAVWRGGVLIHRVE